MVQIKRRVKLHGVYHINYTSWDTEDMPSINELTHILTEQTRFKDMKHVGFVAYSLVFRGVANGQEFICKCIPQASYQNESMYMNLCFGLVKPANLPQGETVESCRKTALLSLDDNQWSHSEIACNLDLHSLYVKGKRDLHLSTPVNYLYLNRIQKQRTCRFVVFITRKCQNTIDALNFAACSTWHKKHLAYSIMEGLLNLHNVRWCHGDIKPSNICVDVVDDPTHGFALDATIIDYGTAHRDFSSHKLTLKNTFAFMSPHQAYLYVQPQNNMNIFVHDKLGAEDIIKCNDALSPFFQGFQGESNVWNDWFCFCIILFYIFGEQYIFWCQSHITDFDKKTCITILQHVALYLQNKSAYVTQALAHVKNMPPDMIYLIHKVMVESVIPSF